MAISNLNQLSAADPSSSPVATPQARAKRQAGSKANGKDREGFNGKLDEELSKKGGILGAQALGVRPATQPRLSAAHLDAAGGKDSFAQHAEQRAMIAQSMGGMAGNPLLASRGVSSADTGSQFAGLKPWDQNWVFEGKPLPATGDVHPLFGKSNSEIEMANMKKVLAQLTAAANAVKAKNAHSGPGAAQVSRNLRTRGGTNVQTHPNEQTAGQLQLAAQLAALNGTAEMHVNPNEKFTARSSQTGQAAQQHAAGNGLSGAEFMRMLSAVRAHNAQVSPNTATQTVDGGGASPKFRVIGGTGKDGTDGVLGNGPGNGKDAQFAAVPLSGAAIGMHGLSAPGHAHATRPAMQLTGHVVQGSMAKNQLTHEVILGMTNGIHSMSANGGGEMRIRLHPDSLGELQLRVRSRGNEVGLQIQASDDKAKKVLEDSLSSLKDSLASQNLTLAHVAIDVAKAATNHGMHQDSGNGSQQNQWSGQQYGQALGQNAGDGRNQRYSSSWSNPEDGRAGTRSLRSVTPASAQALRQDPLDTNGRLDVMA